MEPNEWKQPDETSPDSGEEAAEVNETDEIDEPNGIGTAPEGPAAFEDEAAADMGALPVELQQPKRRRGLKSWVGARAKVVVSKLYETRADDIEERARRAVGSAYKDSADDLEERAVRAMRQALHHEADRIKEAIEHGIAVKKREVRLSLLVLVTASLLYLALYWATHQTPAS